MLLAQNQEPSQHESSQMQQVRPSILAAHETQSDKPNEAK